MYNDPKPKHLDLYMHFLFNSYLCNSAVEESLQIYIQKVI